ncbi:MAG: DUF4838 domain-containing protein [Planctomycetaceae bacterium]|jgi:hypothetical protein|nr:DUF4838 domain-containing protein [Planctomycetaceae bacterium]
MLKYVFPVLLWAVCPGACDKAVADAPGHKELVIASDGRTMAVIVVSPQAGRLERRGADDLAKYIGLMSGSRPQIVATRPAIAAALAGPRPLLVVGKEALTALPSLEVRIKAVLKRKALLRTDGIAVCRHGRRVYLAGNNDRSHYFAVAELLRYWGCRWYMPTEFGECIPDRPELTVARLDRVYSSPFEIRTYWISWIGDKAGADEFRLRNMMTDRSAMPPTGHALGKFTAGLGKGTFKFPITAASTAKHVAGQVEKRYARGGAFSLGMEDGSYDSADSKDQELMRLQWDKYFMRWSVTDPMLELYNNVARILQAKYPDSRAKIGFLAYANMTIPPVRAMVAERSLFCELAPIDIDPIHGMDDLQSPPRREFREMLYKWAKVMQGRLSIYDYDQGMLVWRDIPNPSHQSFRRDVKHYRRAGVLGVNTESRNAIATTFINLYLRSRLLWNPDADVDELLADFYPRFYGAAAAPMKIYWSTIFDAWEKSICTEHEYFLATAIYTPRVIGILRKQLEDAERIGRGVGGSGRQSTRNEQLVLRRLKFTRLSFGILDAYIAMVNSAATDGDYRAAVTAGERGLAARKAMTALGGIFTTTKLERDGTPWWPGEVRQYRQLLEATDGTRGKLITKLPIEWSFRRDPDNVGVKQKYFDGPVGLAYWNANQAKLTLDNRKDYPDRWSLLRTDLYLQAQGVRHPDRQSYTGHFWYRTSVELTAKQAAGAVHLRFPGLFNESWLYVNGREVAYRKQGKLWWRNDYRFEWDVELAGKMKAGKNEIALRGHCEHHFGGMFRRPFLYRKTGK